VSGHGIGSKSGYHNAVEAMEYEASRAAGPPAERADTERRTTEETRGLLLEVSRATASHRDLPSLLRELAALLCRIARAEQLSLVLYDPQRDRMRLHTVAACEPVAGIGLDLAMADSPSGTVWQTQQPLIIPSIERETRFGEVMQRLLADGMSSLCVLPLTSPLRRLGGLGFASREENAFQPADLEFLQQLTSQVALAVDNTLHHEAAQGAQRELARERDRLSLLLEINNALVSNLEPRALFSAICRFLRRVVAHEYTSLGIYDAKQNAFDLWAIEFAGKGLLREHMIVPMEGSPAGVAFAAGRAVLFERADLEVMSSEPAALLLAEGVQRMCTVPLTAHDRRLGALGVGRVGGEPFTPDDVEILTAVAKQVAFSIENALAFQEIETLKEKLEAEKVYLQDEIRTQHNFEEIIGDSTALKRILHEVETVAPTDSAILITGETGSGKELIARAVHALSARRERTFVTINCAAIPSGLLESELFGHERGAFTGAIAQRIGRFELADRGTLFLDEVGDIPLELQPKLLRVLQEREFERLGSTRTKHVDVRVVAATNRNLEAMVAAGTFRSDLYYRLNVFPIALPPLRDRPEDIPALVRYFVRKFARRMKKQFESVPTDGMAALCRYAWPGNVRELENAIERAVILSSGPSLRIVASEFPAAANAAPVGVTLEATERDAIVRALGDTNWVLGGPQGAAARLGLKRTTLQSRMRKLGIDRPKVGD
jgi:formate hydrogenlyase transcriptional activator